jgi:hypothetical protein
LLGLRAAASDQCEFVKSAHEAGVANPYAERASFLPSEQFDDRADRNDVVTQWLSRALLRRRNNQAYSAFHRIRE